MSATCLANGCGPCAEQAENVQNEEIRIAVECLCNDTVCLAGDDDRVEGHVNDVARMHL